jgi:hypothetical protein
MKPLRRGRVACAVFNRGEAAHPVQAAFSALGISGAARARDLWRGRGLELLKDSGTAAVPAHGVASPLLRR